MYFVTEQCYGTTATQKGDIFPGVHRSGFNFDVFLHNFFSMPKADKEVRGNHALTNSNRGGLLVIHVKPYESKLAQFIAKVHTSVI